MQTDGIEQRRGAMGMTRRSVIAASAIFLAGRAEASPQVLTPEHAGRYMRTRNGERIGPVEYDAASFGRLSGKRWRAPLDWARAYYWANGQVIDGEEGPHDIVGEWDHRGGRNVASGQ
jgi:hypothetical protein